MRVTSGIVFSLLLLIAAAPALAHHSFPAEFDATKCTDVTGTLTKVDWQNPHAYIFVTNAANEDATFQLSSPSNLSRGGTDRHVLVENFGKTVTVRGCASRNGEKNRFAASLIRLPNGEVHRLGQDVEGIFGTKRWN
jgi:hypothetical protein